MAVRGKGGRHRKRIEWLAELEMNCSICHHNPSCNCREVGNPPMHECVTCNYTGKQPMFPMLRRECLHNSDGGVCFEIDYTASPMDALLGRIEKLRWTWGRETYDGESFYWITVPAKPYPLTYESPREGTNYQRLIAALYEAAKAWQEAKG